MSEERIREIVREELERELTKSLREGIKELRLLVEDLGIRQKAYDARLAEMDRRLEKMIEVVNGLVEATKGNTISISELGKRTEENTKAIEELRTAVAELGKRTEENTKAIEELRTAVAELGKRTEENTKAIEELRTMTLKNAESIRILERTVANLVKAVKGINRRLGGLENTFGLIIEDSVNRDLVSWFKSEGIELPSLRARTLKVGNRVLEFDFYAEVGNKVFVGEIKTTLRERDVTKFARKVELLRSHLKGREVIPLIIYRNRMGRPIALAKGSNIRVLKYLKGGAFEEIA